MHTKTELKVKEITVKSIVGTVLTIKNSKNKQN